MAVVPEMGLQSPCYVGHFDAMHIYTGGLPDPTCRGDIDKIRIMLALMFRVPS